MLTMKRQSKSYAIASPITCQTLNKAHANFQSRHDYISTSTASQTSKRKRGGQRKRYFRVTRQVYLLSEIWNTALIWVDEADNRRNTTMDISNCKDESTEYWTHQNIATFLVGRSSRRTRTTFTKIMLPQCSIFTSTPNHIWVSNFNLQREYQFSSINQNCTLQISR